MEKLPFHISKNSLVGFFFSFNRHGYLKNKALNENSTIVLLTHMLIIMEGHRGGKRAKFIEFDMVLDIFNSVLK